jgi:hypothetical protein
MLVRGVSIFFRTQQSKELTPRNEGSLALNSKTFISSGKVALAEVSGTT